MIHSGSMPRLSRSVPLVMPKVAASKSPDRTHPLKKLMAAIAAAHWSADALQMARFRLKQREESARTAP